MSFGAYFADSEQTPIEHLMDISSKAKGFGRIQVILGWPSVPIPLSGQASRSQPFEQVLIM